MIKCLLDLDGVVSNFVQGICNAHGVENPFLDSKNHGNYNITDMLGMSKTEFWKPADSHLFWSGLQPMNDSGAILQVVEKHFGRENICLLSSPSNSPFSLAGKLLWIKKYMPDYKRSFLIGPRKEFCANPSHVLIDDYEYNVTRFRESGGRAVLVARPWNKKHTKAAEAASDLDKCLTILLGSMKASGL